MFLRPGFVVVIVGATLTSLSTVIVALRYYSRHFIMRSLGASDHLMFVALVVTWGNFVVNYYQDETSRRFRPSFFRDPAKRLRIETALRGTLITWWVYRMSYILGLCFRRFVNATIIFISLYTFSAIIASAFQCENPSDSWSTAGYLAQFDRDPKTKRPKVKCYDPVRLWIFSATVNLLSDVVILLLPIPALLSLRVPMSRRLALIGIFSVGIMAIVASSVRMWVMMLWAESPVNSARFGSDLLLWGQVETNSGIISASVPFLRPLFHSRQKEERIVAPRKLEISPPKPVDVEKAPEVETWAAYEMEKEKDPALGEAQTGWQPFITVPESISSGSRDSARLEPTHHPHMTV